MRNYIAMAVALGLSVGIAAAHDTGIIDATFTGIGAGAAQGYDHEDTAPWAGWVTVSATNEGTEPWGDFHFELYQVTGDITNVDWKDAAGGGNDPVSSQTLDSYAISPDGGTIDLYFYGDPVLPGETATFDVYNVNPDQVTFFGVSFHPTPVPEPVSLMLLGLGGLLLRRR